MLGIVDLTNPALSEDVNSIDRTLQWLVDANIEPYTTTHRPYPIEIHFDHQGYTIHTDPAWS